MTIEHISGDLLMTDEPAIAHGVNCQGMMGSGIAKPIRNMYGEDMFKEYRFRCMHQTLLPGGFHLWSAENRPLLLNVASQNKTGSDARLDWLVLGMIAALSHVSRYNHVSCVALPRIGCGIGGLKWEDVLPALEEISEHTGVNLKVYTL